jgi:hypothetical protein
MAVVFVAVDVVVDAILGLVGGEFALGDFAFEVEQEAVDVFFRPFAAVEALEHATGGVFSGPVLEVAQVGGANRGEPIGVGYRFGLGDEGEIVVEIGIESVVDVSFHVLGLTGPRPEENGREERFGFVGEVATPGEDGLVFLEGLHDGGRVLGFVGVVVEQGLHVDRDQMPAR